MASTRDMLQAIVRNKTLKSSDREVFQDMLDRHHRYRGKLSGKQERWIASKYFDLEEQARKKRAMAPRFMGSKPKASTPPSIGYINYSGTRETLLVTNIDMLRSLCPNIKPDTSQYRKIQGFFENGGQVLKIKPVESRASA